MSAAAFTSSAIFIWSRNRRSFLAWGVIYALVFVGSQTLSLPQAHLWSVGVFLVIAPVVLPLASFVGSSMASNPDLTNPDGLFPRQFFVLPAAAHQLVLPFMLYAALFAALQWIAAAVISDSRLPWSELLWLPFVATSLITWMQALMWTPVRRRLVRTLQLFVLLGVYLTAVLKAIYGTLSSEVLIALSLAQFPIAYAVAVYGVAKCRRGEPGARVVISAARGKPRLPQLVSPLAAQLWVERRIHRWSGKSTLFALLPAVLLIVLFIAWASGGAERNPEGLQTLGQAVIVLLFVSLAVIGISTGINFSSFRARVQWHHADAYLMPPYFAALPFATGDFAWAKMRAAAQRMLWLSAGVVLTCGVVAEISGFSDAWWSSHAAWREQYGLAATLMLAVLPTLAVVMLVLSATASVMWVALLGRHKAIVSWLVLSAIMLQFVLLMARRSFGFDASALPDIIAIVAVVKLCGLAALMFYVGSRRILSWPRVAAIAGFWAATAGTLVAWWAWYAPQGLISSTTALCAAMVVAPVLGALAAPLALARNRTR